MSTFLWHLHVCFCVRVFSAAASSRTSTTRCVWRTRTVWSCGWTVTDASTAVSRNASPSACREMVRHHDIFLFNEREARTALPKCHSVLISPGSREMDSQKASQCTVCRSLREKIFWVIMPLAHLLSHYRTCTCHSLLFCHPIATNHLSFWVSFCCPLQHPPATHLPLSSHSPHPFMFLLCSLSSPAPIPWTVIYEKRSPEVPQAIYHWKNCSKHRNYFGKLEQGQLDYLVYVCISCC